jgi:hypothetical protein
MESARSQMKSDEGGKRFLSPFPCSEQSLNQRKAVQTGNSYFSHFSLEPPLHLHPLDVALKRQTKGNICFISTLSSGGAEREFSRVFFTSLRRGEAILLRFLLPIACTHGER